MVKSFFFLYTFHVPYWNSNNVEGNIDKRQALGNRFIQTLKSGKTFSCFFLVFLNQVRTDSYKHGPLQIATATLCGCTKVWWNYLLENNYQLSGYNHFLCLDQEKYWISSGNVNNMHYVKHFHWHINSTRHKGNKDSQFHSREEERRKWNCSYASLRPAASQKLCISTIK